MRTLFASFILILFAIGIGFAVQKDPGYILLAYGGWTLETSFWAGILAVFFISFLIYFLVRLIHAVFGLDLRFRNWSSKRKHRKMHEKLELGVYRALQGNWGKSEKNFRQAMQYNGKSPLPYLGAAYSANQQEALDRVEHYLDEAMKVDPDAHTALLFARARLFFQSENWDAAEKLIQELRENDPKNKALLQMLEEIYFECEDWENFLKLLPNLVRLKIISLEEAKNLSYFAFSQSLESENSVEPEILWNLLPTEYHYDAEFLSLYAEFALQNQHDEEVASLIEVALKKEWQPELLHFYSAANADKKRQLAIGEKWLKKYPENPELLLCVAKLSANLNEQDKAENYLQSALKIAPSPEIYQTLGQVFAAKGDLQKAIYYFQLGLKETH